MFYFSYVLYALGCVALIAGVSWLAHLSHIPESYIVAIAAIMLGIGVMNGVESARRKDSNY